MWGLEKKYGRGTSFLYEKIGLGINTQNGMCTSLLPLWLKA